jgi:hypothetical protein
MKKKFESDNSNFTGVRLDTTNAPFAKESKMNKQSKHDSKGSKDKRHKLVEDEVTSERTYPKSHKQSVIIVNETAAELLADKIDTEKKEDKLVENQAEVMAAAQKAAKEKVAEIKERDSEGKAESIG